MMDLSVVRFWRIWPWEKIAEVAVLVLVAGAVLWKGGKTLEATWVLVGVSWLCTIIYWKKSMTSAHDDTDVTPSRARGQTPMFLWLSVMLFIGWTVISYRYSTTQNYGLDEVLQTGALGLMFLWIIRNGSIQNRLLNVVAWTTMIACVIGVLVYVLQPVNRFVGTFFDSRFHTDYWPNALAEYLLLAWPVLLYWLNAQKKIFKYSFLILGFVLGCFLLSYSRAATLAFGGQLVLWWILLQWQEEKGGERLPWKMIRTHVLVTALIAGGVFFVINGIRGSTFDVQNLKDKAVFTADEGYSSVSERQQFWNQSMALLWRKPVAGWGPYSFRFVQPHLQEGVLATSDHPHNVLLKYGMERGMPGMVFFILIVGTVLCGALRKIRHSLFAVHCSLAIPIFVSVVGVLAHNMVDYNLQFVGIALPFWLLLGVLASHGTQSPLDYTRGETSLFIRITEVLLATALILVALFEGRFLLVSSLGRHAESKGEEARALLWYDEGKKSWFDRDLQLSRSHLLINKNSFTEGLIGIEEYIKRNAEDYRGWKLKGDLLLLDGRAEEARSAYERAALFGGGNDLGILRGIMETLVRLDAWDTLRARLPQIEGEMQHFAEAIEQNTHFIALSSNVEEYLLLSNRLAALYPKDAPRYQLMGARVDRAATREREKMKARPVGRLW